MIYCYIIDVYTSLCSWATYHNTHHKSLYNKYHFWQQWKTSDVIYREIPCVIKSCLSCIYMVICISGKNTNLYKDGINLSSPWRFYDLCPPCKWESILLRLPLLILRGWIKGWWACLHIFLWYMHIKLAHNSLLYSTIVMTMIVIGYSLIQIIHEFLSTLFPWVLPLMQIEQAHFKNCLSTQPFYLHVKTKKKTKFH